MRDAFMVMKLMWDAFHDYFAGTIVIFYGILFCFGVYKVFDLFADVA